MSQTGTLSVFWGTRNKKNNRVYFGLKSLQAKQAKGLTSWQLTFLVSPWARCARRALKRSRPRWRRGLRTAGWAGCPSFSSCLGPEWAPREGPQRSHPRILHVGPPETPRCCSGSCWWTAASTSRGAASLWPTRPGRVLHSEAEDSKRSHLYLYLNASILTSTVLELSEALLGLLLLCLLLCRYLNFQ